MDYSLFALYCLVTFSFLPVFIYILVKLKQDFHSIYDKVKIKLSLLLIILTSFLSLRLYFYIDFKMKWDVYKDPTIFSIVPFYASEIIITISICYVLYKVSRLE